MYLIELYFDRWMYSVTVEFRESLDRQLVNYESPAPKYFWTSLYNRLSKTLPNQGKILEVGAGGGASKKFLTNQGILRTDILPFEEVIGDVDLLNLKFEDNSFDAVFGVDVLHHIADPHLALSQIERILSLESGAKIVFVEPWVSWFSYPIYRMFHHEKTSFFSPVPQDLRILSSLPEDADQTLVRWLFTSKSHQSRLYSLFPRDKYQIELTYISFLNFFMTGGLRKPLSTPIFLLKAMEQIESKIPQYIMKKIASRVFIVITKTSSRF
jgi:SAM-dependent methyltransferase